MLCSDRVLTLFDPSRQLLIDFDASKERGIGAMAYHVNLPEPISEYPVRTKVKPILFLSRLLRPAEHKILAYGARDLRARLGTQEVETSCRWLEDSARYHLYRP